MINTIFLSVKPGITEISEPNELIKIIDLLYNC